MTHLLEAETEVGSDIRQDSRFRSSFHDQAIPVEQPLLSKHEIKPEETRPLTSAVEYCSIHTPRQTTFSHSFHILLFLEIERFGHLLERYP